MTEFFIADMHFGGASNAKWRKFASADDMDARIIDAWNDRVGASDTVWVLGDTGSPMNPVVIADAVAELADDRP